MTETRVYLTCRACGHRWLQAILKASDRISNAVIAGQAVCPECGCDDKPVVAREEQPELPL